MRINKENIPLRVKVLFQVGIHSPFNQPLYSDEHYNTISVWFVIYDWDIENNFILLTLPQLLLTGVGWSTKMSHCVWETRHFVNTFVTEHMIKKLGGMRDGN